MSPAQLLVSLCLSACAAPLTDTARCQDGDGDGHCRGQDCDDSEPTVHPDAAEVCDGLDNDCDGESDEGLLLASYLDQDGDGYGNGDSATRACEISPGYSPYGTDCDDLDTAVHPYAIEVCNGLDDDCDGLVDVGAGETWYLDADGDGWGDTQEAVMACGCPPMYVAESGDCDDAHPGVHPEASERCDGLDEDCDGVIDDGLMILWYQDADGDGYGDDSVVVEACEQPSGTAWRAGDCDDSSEWVHPGTVDDCDGYDDDCDGQIDEDVKSGWRLMSVDTVGDTIWDITPATAWTTAITSVEGYDINSMDVHEDGTAFISIFGSHSLGTIDPCSGEVTSIGSTGVGSMGAISFGPGGYLYGLAWEEDTLVVLDTATGQAQTVGGLGFNFGHSGLAYDCSRNTRWGADSNTNSVFQVDAATGQAYNFISTPIPFDHVGLEYFHRDGLLLASTESELYVVDVTTGVTTFVGRLLGSNFNDLAFHPPCP